VMNPSTEADDLTIDGMTACGDCCSYEGITWQDFLEAFDQNLPDPGQRTLLRIHDAKTAGSMPGLLVRSSALEH
jgi:hypothetical protein